MRYFPLYEAKMFHQFDHRWATFAGADQVEVEDEEEELLGDEEEGEGGGDKAKTRDVTLSEKQDPRYLPTPRYWVSEADVLMKAVPLDRKEKKELEAMDPERVVARLRPRAPQWLIAFRDIARSTDERTAIFSALPLVGAGHKAPLAVLAQPPREQLAFMALTDSMVWDWMCRQKLGGTSFTLHYLKQIGTLLPGIIDEPTLDRIVSLALELVYTSEHLRPLAEARGYTGDPFPYDEARRAVLRAELDALVARLYGLNRKQLRYILDPHGLSWGELENINDGEEDSTCSGPHALPAEPALDFPGETFRVLKEKEERKYGEYRTRRLVLEAWDRLWNELGPVEPLPIKFGGSDVDRFVGSDQPTQRQTSRPTNLAPVATGLFAEPPQRPANLQTQPADLESPDPPNLPSSQPSNLFDLAPEPKAPTPLMDKQGSIIRVRVLGASGQEIVVAGTVVGQRKQGKAVEWAVLVDETNAVRKFLSPPAILKRLKEIT